MQEEIKIPTSEEFSKNYSRLRSAMALKDLSEFAIEFAKLHVQEALRQASEKAYAYYDEDDGTHGNINKDSILNSYPLNLIK